ncbi:Sec1 family protein [Histomonas meleagridis]|uniref:Sec1 family protein n=1 Tax=Histomonas meleagridis TaxID=135588 RepID=UPI003559C019|nr:Sec1 family protein [Histomonas meleagridis]KAH0802955.1 Sec1 family protein [Histomonas meleagridis]
MDFNTFINNNVICIKKLISRAPTVRHRAVHPSFLQILLRICYDKDKNLLSDLGKLEAFDHTFGFNLSETYCLIIPSEIEVVQKAISLFKSSTAKPTVEIFLYPYMTSPVAAYLNETMPCSKASLVLFGESKIPEDKDPIKFTDLGVDLLPLDKDLVTMITPSSMTRIWSLNDLTIFSELRNAINRIFAKFGSPSSVISVGPFSKQFAEQIENVKSDGNFQLVIVDRMVDPITPLLSSLNYESQIAEYLGIEYGLTSNLESHSLNKSYYLLSAQADHLIEDFRVLNTSEFKSAFNKVNAEFNAALNGRSGNDFDSIRTDVREASNSSIKHQSISAHYKLIHAIEHLKTCAKWHEIEANQIKVLRKDYTALNSVLRDMFDQCAPIDRIVNALSLLSVMKGGFEELDGITKEMYRNYGIQVIPYLIRLSHLGLILPKHQQSFSWDKLFDVMNMFNPNWKNKGDDAASAFEEGFAPLMVRIIERILKNEINLLTKALNNAKYKVEVQVIGNPTPKKYLICFIGGVTYTEVNLLRRIAKKIGVEINFLTTEIYNRKQFFDSIAYGIPGLGNE